MTLKELDTELKAAGAASAALKALTIEELLILLLAQGQRRDMQGSP